MDWWVYADLCEERGESPNGVAAKLGFSNSACTKWKKGSVPGGDTLRKIADYFGVSVGYLLGRSGQYGPDDVDESIYEILSGMTRDERIEVLDYLRGKV